MCVSFQAPPPPKSSFQDRKHHESTRSVRKCSHTGHNLFNAGQLFNDEFRWSSSTDKVLNWPCDQVCVEVLNLLPEVGPMKKLLQDVNNEFRDVCARCPSLSYTHQDTFTTKQFIFEHFGRHLLWSPATCNNMLLFRGAKYGKRETIAERETLIKRCITKILHSALQQPVIFLLLTALSFLWRLQSSRLIK